MSEPSAGPSKLDFAAWWQQFLTTPGGDGRTLASTTRSGLLAAYRSVGEAAFEAGRIAASVGGPPGGYPCRIEDVAPELKEQLVAQAATLICDRLIQRLTAAGGIAPPPPAEGNVHPISEAP